MLNGDGLAMENGKDLEPFEKALNRTKIVRFSPEPCILARFRFGAHAIWGGGLRVQEALSFIEIGSGFSTIRYGMVPYQLASILVLVPV